MARRERSGSERLAALADVVIATGGRTYTLATLPHLLEVPEVAALKGTAAPPSVYSPRAARGEVSCVDRVVHAWRRCRKRRISLGLSEGELPGRGGGV